MIVKFEDRDWTLDTDEIELLDAMYIKSKTAMTLRQWQNGLEDSDPAALAALYWLMRKQNNARIDFERINFKVVPFMSAFDEAQKASVDVAESNPTTLPQTDS